MLCDVAQVPSLHSSLTPGSSAKDVACGCVDVYASERPCCLLVPCGSLSLPTGGAGGRARAGRDLQGRPVPTPASPPPPPRPLACTHAACSPGLLAVALRPAATGLSRPTFRAPRPVLCILLLLFPRGSHGDKTTSRIVYLAHSTPRRLPIAQL